MKEKLFDSFINLKRAPAFYFISNAILTDEINNPPSKEKEKKQMRNFILYTMNKNSQI